jgi:transketolase
MKRIQTAELVDVAKRIRIDVTKMFYKWGHGHFGGSFSAAEILAVLFFHSMNVNPSEPEWEDRDRFVMSKGHAAASLFSAMAQKGYFPREWLDQYGDLGAALNTHPSKGRVTGLDFSSGSLGHGLPAGLGMAWAAKAHHKDYKTYVLLGDGECHEGMIWEAALGAPAYELDNLIAVVDRNRMCIAGFTEDWMPLEPFENKWRAFNWDVYIADGHDVEDLAVVLDAAVGKKNGKPKVIIANTVKGKGVPVMENDKSWHSHVISDELYKKVMRGWGESIE